MINFQFSLRKDMVDPLGMSKRTASFMIASVVIWSLLILVVSHGHSCATLFSTRIVYVYVWFFFFPFVFHLCASRSQFTFSTVLTLKKSRPVTLHSKIVAATPWVSKLPSLTISFLTCKIGRAYLSSGEDWRQFIQSPRKQRHTVNCHHLNHERSKGCGKWKLSFTKVTLRQIN